MSGGLLVFAGSLAGILVLVLVSRGLELGRDARISDEAEAREIADNAICGFDARDVALDAGGRGALLQDSAGRIMLLVPHGAHFAARLLEAREGTVRAGGNLTIAGTTLDLGDSAGTWETRIEALDS